MTDLSKSCFPFYALQLELGHREATKSLPGVFFYSFPQAKNELFIIIATHRATFAFNH
jgi:hypothetical protein